MRRFAAALAVTACAVTGCTSGTAAPTPTAPAAARASASAPPPAVAPAADVIRAVQLPAGHRKLLPVAEQKGNAALPVFTPKQEAYTLFLRCQGGGDLTVRYNNESDVDTWPCDGVLNRSRVYGAREPQKLTIRAAETATWSIGIVDGAA